MKTKTGYKITFPFTLENQNKIKSNHEIDFIVDKGKIGFNFFSELGSTMNTNLEDVSFYWQKIDKHFFLEFDLKSLLRMANEISFLDDTKMKLT